MLVKNLIFRVPIGAPETACNCCGKKVGGGVLVADVDEDIVIIVCGETCKRIFINHPLSQMYLDNLVSRVNLVRNQ